MGYTGAGLTKQIKAALEDGSQRSAYLN